MAKREIFDLQKVQGRDYEALTRVGDLAMITQITDEEYYPLKGKIMGRKKPHSWTIEGKYLIGKIHSNDLQMRKVKGK